LRLFSGGSYNPPVLPTAVIVSDAHIGYASKASVLAFHRFLDTVPDLGSHLVINGDLFEFWFEYRTVIPRQAFPTLEAMRRLTRAGVAITLTGGNHDRWGGAFWREDMGAAFHAGSVELELCGLSALVQHGDGLGEHQLSARMLHAVTRHRLTTALFRWIHPDLGLELVRRMSPRLAGKARSEAAVDEAAKRQEEHARVVLGRRPDVNVVVLGHTHRARLVEVAPRQWFLNPGAWIEGGRFALVTEDGPRLEAFDG
jgi:UDP-2,3-diacylglucosamine hydrolase